MVQDEQLIIQLISEADSPEKSCEKLVSAANLAGGEDNIGVVVLKVT